MTEPGPPWTPENVHEAAVALEADRPVRWARVITIAAFCLVLSVLAGGLSFVAVQSLTGLRSDVDRLHSLLETSRQETQSERDDARADRQALIASLDMANAELSRLGQQPIVPPVGSTSGPTTTAPATPTPRTGGTSGGVPPAPGAPGAPGAQGQPGTPAPAPGTSPPAPTPTTSCVIGLPPPFGGCVL